MLTILADAGLDELKNNCHWSVLSVKIDVAIQSSRALGRRSSYRVLETIGEYKGYDATDLFVVCQGDQRGYRDPH